MSNRLLTGKGGSGKAKGDPSGWRLPASAFENAVTGLLTDHFEQSAASQSILTAPDVGSAPGIAAAVANLVTKLKTGDRQVLSTILSSVQLGAKSIRIALDPSDVAQTLGVSADAISACLLTFVAPFELRRRGIETRIIAGANLAAPDPTLLRTLAKAHAWVQALREGRSFAEIAKTSGQSDAYIRTRIQLAFLSPSLQAAILAGKQPTELSLESILRRGVPLAWVQQESQFGRFA